MKIKFGSFVTEGSGKIGGHVAGRNRAGAYLRTKTTPTNPQTAYQLNVRQTLTVLSQGWRALTQNQIAAWNAAVGDFQRTDVFGDLRRPTGKNLYTLLNTNLINSGQATISSPPLPGSVQGYVATALAISVGGTSADITFTGSSATNSIHIWATDGASPGVSFAKNRFRFLGSIAGNTASPYDAWTLYTARFGTPTVGTKVFFKITGVNNTTGQSGQFSQVETIVAV